MKAQAALALVLLSSLPAAGAEERTALLQGLGSHQRRVDTRSPQAQQFFDQGLVLAYGFNHAAAGRAFAEALRLDPACAMCAWGVALVLGPHINAAMEASAVSRPGRRPARPSGSRRVLRPGPRADRGAGQALLADARRRAEAP